MMNNQNGTFNSNTHVSNVSPSLSNNYYYNHPSMHERNYIDMHRNDSIINNYNGNDHLEDRSPRINRLENNSYYDISQDGHLMANPNDNNIYNNNIYDNNNNNYHYQRSSYNYNNYSGSFLEETQNFNMNNRHHNHPLHYEEKLKKFKYNIKKRNKRNIKKIELKVNDLLNSLNVHIKTDKMEVIFLLNKYFKKLNKYKKRARHFNTIGIKELGRKTGIPSHSQTTDLFDNIYLNNNHMNNASQNNFLFSRDSFRHSSIIQDVNQEIYLNDQSVASDSSSTICDSDNNDNNDNGNNNDNNGDNNDNNGDNNDNNGDNNDNNDDNNNNYLHTHQCEYLSYNRSQDNCSPIEKDESNFNNNFNDEDYHNNGLYKSKSCYIRNMNTAHMNDSSNDEFYSNNFLYTPNKNIQNESYNNYKNNDISFDNINGLSSFNHYINDRRYSQLSFFNYDTSRHRNSYGLENNHRSNNHHFYIGRRDS
ncbi:hypothetical protein PFTANZ_06434, partial [Plasmodium falciparum Tanzania (2000708)]